MCSCVIFSSRRVCLSLSCDDDDDDNDDSDDVDEPISIIVAWSPNSLSRPGNKSCPKRQQSVLIAYNFVATLSD